MNVIAAFDLMYFFSALAVLVFLIGHWRHALKKDIKIFLTGLLLTSIGYSLFLFLEWSEIATTHEAVEDFICALLPMWWALLFYSILNTITFHDLDRSERRYRDLVESMSEGIMTIDRNTTFTFFNPSMEEMLGYDKEELMDRSIFHFMDRENQALFKAQIENWKKDRIEKFELQWIKKNGGELITMISPQPVTNNGMYSGNVSVLSDITGIKQIEEEKKKIEVYLQHTQKMEALGTLAGGIAHDFNNILMGILGYAELVLSDLPQNGPLWLHQQEIITAGKRARELIKQILTFSRRVEQEMMPTQINTIIKEALQLLRSSIPSTIDIQTTIESNCGFIQANPTKIHQIVMNLCTNAYYAMKNTGGILHITLSKVDMDEKSGMHLEPGSYARLEISDTGCGMSQSTMDRIFEPYYTTKPIGEGTGLGLSTVHSIVESYHGRITVQSEMNQGTTFTLYFPRIDNTADSIQTKVRNTQFQGKDGPQNFG